MRNQLIRNLVVVFFFIALTGCRTYGDYGTEQASYDQIETINTQFVQDLERAKGELQVLKRAAGIDGELHGAVAQYEALLVRHEEMIAEHEKWTQPLIVKTGLFGKLSTSYRDLSRALGYIAAEQLSMHKQYDAFAASLLSEAQRATFQVEQGRYQVAPPFYEQIRFALAKRSISDALDQRAGS